MSLFSLVLALLFGGAGGLDRRAASAAAPATARVIAPAAVPHLAPLGVARLQYGGGGDWYANPSALPNLLEAVRLRTGLPVADREVVITPLDPGLRDHPFLFLTGHGEVAFAADERQALRSYLESGGFLLADDTYGLDESFRREMALLFPDRPLTELPPDHPVFHLFYELPGGLPKIHEHTGAPPQAFGIFHEGRLVVFYSFESDLGDGWEDPQVHDNPPELREAALRMGVNLFLYAVSRAAP
ncbi:MAG: DUF4159 domain-containing protein [Gemmatimonadota bacterium]